ncbi:MAG: hypothetical protein IKC81_05690 [Paludibacteraceae bacterium]|nr:hypothetical protein [Paludibacteraceae bacterium]
MELKHYLQYDANRLEIGEPIGFDSMKTTIKRGEYHGMSAQVTVSSLEFYGEAAHFIKEQYDTNIDAEIGYVVTDVSHNVIYEGVLDMSTFSEKKCEYYSVSLKIGDVGVKTMFNNRTTTDVDIYSNKTIEGNTISSIYKHSVYIPNKAIVYTNLMEAKEDVVWTSETAQTGRFKLPRNKSHHWINFPICEKLTLEEFGTCSPQADIAESIKGDDMKISGSIVSEYYTPLFDAGEDFAAKFGDNSPYSIELNVTVTVEAIGENNLFDLYNNKPPGYIWNVMNEIPRYDVQLVMMDGEAWIDMPWTNPEWVAAKGNMVAYTGQYSNYLENDNRKLVFTLKQTKNGYVVNNKTGKLVFGIALRNNYFYDDGVAMKRYHNEEQEMRVTVHAGSYIRMSLKSQFTEKVKTKFVLINSALNQVIRTISNNQLNLKSSLLDLNPPKSIAGPMALLGLATGYDIRGFSDKGFNISFKDMIEALDALGCIGWSFEDEEGQTFVRVERWDYFYNNDVILEIDGPNEITTQLDVDNVITKLTIGYKKYSTNEDINSIDNIHSERVYNSQVKSVSKEVSKLCTFIADNYAIEEARRKSIEMSSDEFKYDENIFVFELEQQYPTIQGANFLGKPTYTIRTGVENPKNITDVYTTYNVRISPRRMAENWRGRMSLFNTNKNIQFVSGKVNYKAAAKPTRYHGSYEAYYKYYEHDKKDTLIAEDSAMSYERPIMRAEKVKLKYPTTNDQYQTILANPYGIVRVNGADYWIKEMHREFTSGETEFTLIPKNQ